VCAATPPSRIPETRSSAAWGEPDLVVGLACRTYSAGVLGLPGTPVAALPNEVTRFVDGLEDNLAMRTGTSGARVLQLVDLHGT
jgi:hypothetical protein